MLEASIHLALPPPHLDPRTGLFGPVRPAITDPNDPSFAKDPWNNDMLARGSMRIFDIRTCSINGDPSGASIAVHMKHDLKFNCFGDLIDPDFIFDPSRYDATDLIHSSVANAKIGTPLDFLRTAMNHPHNAILSLATGINRVCKVVHTLRSHNTDLENPSDYVREMTVIEGGGRRAQLLTVKEELEFGLVAHETLNAPTIAYWANRNFEQIDPSNIPEDLFAPTTIVASFLVPSWIPTLIYHFNLDGDTLDASVLLEVILQMIDEAEERRLNLLGLDGPTWTDRFRIGRRPAGAKFLFFSKEKADILSAFLPLINALWASSRMGLTFSSAFRPSSNPLSLNWFKSFAKAIDSGDFDYDKHCQAADTHIDIICPGSNSFSEPPLTNYKPTFTNAIGIPTNRPALREVRGPMDDFVTRDPEPPTHSTRPDSRTPVAKDPRKAKPSAKAKKANVRASKHPRPSAKPTPNLTAHQRAHAKKNSVIRPEESIMDDSSDDDSLFGPSSPAPKRLKTDRSWTNDPDAWTNNPSEILMADPPLETLPVDTATIDGNHCGTNWTPHRPATPHPMHDKDLDVDELDDDVDEEIEVSTLNHAPNDGFFRARKPSQHAPNFNPNFESRTIPTNAPRTNFNNNFTHQPGHVSLYQGYNQAGASTHQDALARVLSEFTGMVKAQNSLQEKVLEQREAHHQDREDKRISQTQRSSHLNAATVDGRHPASSLTPYDESYLKAKNAVEAKDQFERDMHSHNCQVAISPHVGRAVNTGRLHCDRLQLGGLSVVTLPVSANNTSLQDFDFAQAFLDHQNGHEISNRAKKLLSHPLLVLPRNMHYLIDQVRNFCIALFLILGSSSLAYRAAAAWLKWIEKNKQYLMDLTLNGGDYKHLSVKIAYQIHNSFNNWFIASNAGVPEKNILNSSLFRQQLLDGNAHVCLPRSIEDLLAPRRSNNSNQNSTQNSNRATNQGPTGGGRPNSAPSSNQRADHKGQPASLATTAHAYKVGVGPAIMRGGVSVPDYKDRTGTVVCNECAKYALLGTCDSGCPRDKAHVPVTDPNREKRLVSFRRACEKWYNENNKGPNGPDFR